MVLEDKPQEKDMVKKQMEEYIKAEDELKRLEEIKFWKMTEEEETELMTLEDKEEEQQWFKKQKELEQLKLQQIIDDALRRKQETNERFLMLLEDNEYERERVWRLLAGDNDDEDDYDDETDTERAERLLRRERERKKLEDEQKFRDEEEERLNKEREDADRSSEDMSDEDDEDFFGEEAELQARNERIAKFQKEELERAAKLEEIRKKKEEQHAMFEAILGDSMYEQVQIDVEDVDDEVDETHVLQVDNKDQSGFYQRDMVIDGHWNQGQINKYPTVPYNILNQGQQLQHFPDSYPAAGPSYSSVTSYSASIPTYNPNERQNKLPDSYPVEKSISPITPQRQIPLKSTSPLGPSPSYSQSPYSGLSHTQKSVYIQNMNSEQPENDEQRKILRFRRTLPANEYLKMIEESMDDTNYIMSSANESIALSPIEFYLSKVNQYENIPVKNIGQLQGSQQRRFRNGAGKKLMLDAELLTVTLYRRRGKISALQQLRMKQTREKRLKNNQPIFYQKEKQEIQYQYEYYNQTMAEQNMYYFDVDYIFTFDNDNDEQEDVFDEQNQNQQEKTEKLQEKEIIQEQLERDNDLFGLDCESDFTDDLCKYAEKEQDEKVRLDIMKGGLKSSERSRENNDDNFGNSNIFQGNSTKNKKKQKQPSPLNLNQTYPMTSSSLSSLDKVHSSQVSLHQSHSQIIVTQMKQNESIIRETAADEVEIEADDQNLIWNIFVSKLNKIRRNRSLYRYWLQRIEMLDLMGCVDTAYVKFDKQIEIKMTDEMYDQYKEKQNLQLYPYQIELQKQKKKLLKKKQKLLKKKNPSLKTSPSKDQLNTDRRIVHLNLTIQRCAVLFLDPGEKLGKFARPYVFRDGISLARVLIRKNYRVLFCISPNSQQFEEQLRWALDISRLSLVIYFAGVCTETEPSCFKMQKLKEQHALQQQQQVNADYEVVAVPTVQSVETYDPEEENEIDDQEQEQEPKESCINFKGYTDTYISSKTLNKIIHAHGRQDLRLSLITDAPFSGNLYNFSTGSDLDFSEQMPQVPRIAALGSSTNDINQTIGGNPVKTNSARTPQKNKDSTRATYKPENEGKKRSLFTKTIVACLKGDLDATGNQILERIGQVITGQVSVLSGNSNSLFNLPFIP
ncbi:MAG: hypothetical protein EZS28_024392 [Streblomastix strix]|uniref:Uncharacterized protein n=1 Tax=Streblomastix strix TaxID=222440 RepID=A0A5J4VCB0_9EUKA|nr:MAG: hypothetical protein EZS28_024392 [Streblomastix strix]